MPAINSYHVLSLLFKICISLLVGLAVHFSATKYLEHDFESVIHAEIHSTFEEIAQITGELDSVFQSLHALNVSECNEDLLLAMRQHLFSATYIKDLGYVQGDYMLCSTGVGVFKDPVYVDIADYQGPRGAEIWVDRGIELFDQQVKAMIIRNGDFNAVITEQQFDNLISIPVQWRIMFHYQGEHVHVAGHKSLPVPVAAQHKVDDAFFYQTDCSDDVPYCIGTLTPRSYFEEYNQRLLVLWLIISILTAILTFGGLLIASRFRRSIKSRVLRGLKAEQFYCEYQPIVSLSSGHVIGCEVLARFKDNTGPIFPDEFIPVIQDSNKTWEFSVQIMNRVFSDLSPECNALGTFKVNINFFARDIDNGRVLAIEAHPLNTLQNINLVVEVTESEQLASSSSKNTLKSLTESGFQVAIDDFGTGYSNLGQLRQFTCHTLKIDRSFVSEMEDGSIRSSLIPHVVDIAKNINVNIVAEGIENDKQRVALLDAGIAFGQGYHFGKPMSLNKLISQLKSDKPQ